jgi:isoamylase
VINTLRLRQQRNFITTMMVSQGVPMLAHGDELGRSQHGNNNVYAQDNEISWVHWDLNADQKDLLTFTSAAISLRKAHPVLRRRRFFAGDAKHGGKSELGDILWFKPDASEMDEADWNSGFARSVMVFLNGDAIPELDAVGRPITDDHFLLLFNAHTEPIRFTMPAAEFGQNWLVRLDTATGQVDPPNVRPWRARSTHRVEAHAMMVMSTTVVPEAEREASKSRALRATASAAKAPMRP